jgi:hypothetical protein
MSRLHRTACEQYQSATAGVKGFVARVARRCEMASARRRQIAADRGPQQKPGNDSGRTRNDGPTRARSRRADRPRTRAPQAPRRPRPSTDGSAPSRNRSSSGDFVSRRVWAWGRDERQRRRGIDLVIIPTKPTSKARPQVRNRREEKKTDGSRDILRSLRSLPAPPSAPPAQVARSG